MTPDERPLYYFGEDIGILIFQPWYYCIPTVGHVSYAKTYDFPVRFKFVDEPFDAVGFHESSPERKGWNLPAWTRAAQELQEEGVRAIVCGCGLTGMIQKELSAAVDIPVYTSTLLFVPEIHRTVAKGKPVGILTVSREQLLAHGGAIFEGCGIDDSIPLAIAGMNESTHAEAWLTQTTPAFDQERVEQAVVETAQQLKRDNPEMGAIVLECTEMPPYSSAIRSATGLPVFDPVDMIKRVQQALQP